MPLETGTTINDLDATWPLSSDPVYNGDDHIRLLKAILKSQFPDFNSVLSVSSTELNFMDGVTSNVQDQIDAASGAAAGVIPSGTVMLFYQAAAPVGWTIVGTHNDAALRVVSSGGGGSSGSGSFSGFMTHTHATSGHSLSESELPAHDHDIVVWSGVDSDATPNFISGRVTSGGGSVTATLSSANAGGGGSHTHGDTGVASISPKYLNVILASKD